LVSELRLTAGCILMDLASPAVSGTSVYANGLKTPGNYVKVDFSAKFVGHFTPISIPRYQRDLMSLDM